MTRKLLKLSCHWRKSASQSVGVVQEQDRSESGSRAPPSSPPLAESPVTLSPEEEARREIEEFMRSSPPPQDEDGNVSVSEVNSHDSDHDLPDEPAALPSSEPVTSNRPIVLNLRNEVERANRQAAHAKLSPYQRERAKELVKMTSLAREVEIFIAVCALDNKLDKIVATIPPFSVSPALLENIKSYTMAVLLSPKLSAYKGTVARDHVIAIIKRTGRHLPTDFDRDHHAQKELKTVIAYELTQARSSIRKKLVTSLDDNQTIFELATHAVAGSQLAVSVTLAARLALMRKVLVTHNNSKYWDHVDTRLQMVRNVTGGDSKKIDKTFAQYLEADRKQYGIDTGYTLDEGDDISDVLQPTSNAVIAGASHIST
ncbi:hypothetical protein D9615_006533 [Tricholomella constricta]|uniref:Uncharacterized protein n=1 Tax=Tricholomella constricta TaxID=117010 RepID=A0A8H5HA42_9AGAR|nr:hypothetical protein D9615_006533 [Tricholomella constricta]